MIPTIGNDQTIQDADPGAAAIAQATRAPVVNQQAGIENRVIPAGAPGIAPVISAAPAQSALIGQLNAIAKGGQARTPLEGIGTILAPTLISAFLSKEDSQRKAGANVAVMNALNPDGAKFDQATMEALANNPERAAEVAKAMLAGSIAKSAKETFTSKYDKTTGDYLGYVSDQSGKFTQAKDMKSKWTPYIRDGKQVGIIDQNGNIKEFKHPNLTVAERIAISEAGSTSLNVGEKINKRRHDVAAEFAAAYSKDIFAMARKSKSQLLQVDLFETALNMGANTGIGQTGVDWLRNAVIRMGIMDSEEVKGKATLQDLIGAISQKQAFEEKPDASGSVSNYEQRLFQLAAIGMSKTEGGNRALIRFKRLIANRRIADARLLSKKMDENGGLFPKNVPGLFINNPSTFTKAEIEELVGYASSESGERLRAIHDAKYLDTSTAELQTLSQKNEFFDMSEQDQRAIARALARRFNAAQQKKSQETGQ